MAAEESSGDDDLLPVVRTTRKKGQKAVICRSFLLRRHVVEIAAVNVTSCDYCQWKRSHREDAWQIR